MLLCDFVVKYKCLKTRMVDDLLPCVIPSSLINRMHGIMTHSLILNSWWVMPLNTSISAVRVQASNYECLLYNIFDSLNGINLSFFPWMNKHGHFTPAILCSLSNRWLNRLAAIDPKLYFTTDLSDVNPDIRISMPHACIEAMAVAGPDPIDLPITMISSGRKFISSVIKFQVGSISSIIACSEGCPSYNEYPGYSTTSI